MKTRALIRADWIVGLPLCSLVFLATLPLRLSTRLAFWKTRRRPLGVQRILVIKFLGLGSVLLATPVLRRLRLAYPHAQITFLTFESNAELVRRLSAVDEVMVVPSRMGALAAGVPAILWRLRRRRFDLAIDLEFYSRLSNLVSWGSGAARRVGFFVRARWRGSLLTDPVYFNATLPLGRAVLALLRPLSLAPETLLEDARDRHGSHVLAQRTPDEALDLDRLDALDAHDLLVPEVEANEARAAGRRLARAGVPDGATLVIVNVNASDLCVERRWPAHRFARLVERFGGEIARVDCFVFIGSAGEQGAVRSVLDEIGDEARPRCLDLSGRTSLSDLMVLLSRSALLISNDSGPLHLGASLGVPTVSFFGPETPALYGPVGDRHLVFYAGHWCSPCLSVYNAKIAMCNGNNECMRRITLDDVVRRTADFCRTSVGLAPPLSVAGQDPREVLPAGEQGAGRVSPESLG